MGIFSRNSGSSSGDNPPLTRDRTDKTVKKEKTATQKRNAELESNHSMTDAQILDALDSNGTGH
jgi:hypothetical protein